MTVQLRNGKEYNIFGHTQAYFLIRGKEPPEYLVKEDILRLKYKNYLLLFSGALSNGALFEIFNTESYGGLNIGGALVVDIGGNIGDSCIYFAVNGANKVICMEPQEISFQAMLKNIGLNHLEEKIIPLMAAAESTETIIKVKQDKNPTGENSLIQSEQGEAVQVLALGSILRKFINNRSDCNKILKIDCEGCEYDLILHSTVEELAQFNQIIVEYHYGIKDLSKKIEKAGFKVEVIKGMIGFNTKSKKHFMKTGILIGRKT
ncbi:MAG: FkbM family methyltransferase [Candidatus Micrarchaeia archaeon]